MSNSWSHKINEMGWVSGEALFVEFALVSAKDKQVNNGTQGLNAPGKTTRLAGQSGEVMTKFGIVRLNRTGLALILHYLMATGVINQATISGEGITEVTPSLWGGI
ncbi:MAG: hypothetical protein P8Z40_03355 [Chloroflexota bacterium]|jgi:hypothetical protein